MDWKSKLSNVAKTVQEKASDVKKQVELSAGVDSSEICESCNTNLSLLNKKITHELFGDKIHCYNCVKNGNVDVSCQSCGVKTRTRYDDSKKEAIVRCEDCQNDFEMNKFCNDMIEDTYWPTRIFRNENGFNIEDVFLGVEDICNGKYSNGGNYRYSKENVHSVNGPMFSVVFKDNGSNLVAKVVVSEEMQERYKRSAASKLKSKVFDGAIGSITGFGTGVATNLKWGIRNVIEDAVTGKEKNRADAKSYELASEVIDDIEKYVQTLTIKSASNSVQSKEEDIVDKLKKITDLKNSGILTEEEYEAKKKELIARL